MKNYLRKFYYGDIPEDKAGGNIVSSGKQRAIGRFGKFLFVANKDWIINM